MFKRVLGIVGSICVIMILLLTSIEIFTFNTSFYDKEYRKYEIPEKIAVSHYDLMIVTDRLLGYMKGTYEDLTIETTIASSRREFFSQREKDHMVDVKNLFDIGYTIRKILLVILLIIILMAFFYDKDVWVSYLKCLRAVIIVFIITVGAFILLALSDFDKYFTLFHEVFFTNDLWLLDPKTDLLVNIVPLNFFIDIFTAVAVLFFILLILLCVISTSVLRMYKKGFHE